MSLGSDFFAISNTSIGVSLKYLVGDDEPRRSGPSERQCKILSSKKETDPFDISICPLFPSNTAEILHGLLFKPRLFFSPPLFIPRRRHKNA